VNARRAGGTVAILLGDFLAIVGGLNFFLALVGGGGVFFDRARTTLIFGVALVFVGAVSVLSDRRSRVS
jgi:hypothetical protein